MKNLFIALFILIFSAQVSAQKAPKGMKFISPGIFTTTIDGNKKELSVQCFWMSNEITNKEFNKFYQDIKQYPDSAFYWLDIKATTEKGEMVKHEIPFRSIIDKIEDNSFKFEDNRTLVEHISDKKIKTFPVTGVTYDMAKYFCWWKSFKYNKKKKRKFLNEFRLPVQEEWEYAAYQDYSNTTHLNELRKSKSGEKNMFHLTNTNSNVNEFVSNKNKKKVTIKGSSIEKTLNYDSEILVDKNYRSSTTGFRIVRTYLGKKVTSD
jgi:formylglycine-generating enzyme required for sulfatase activity